MNCTKNRTPSQVRAWQQCIMANFNTACTGRVTIFSTGGKFRLVSNFTLLFQLPVLMHSCGCMYSHLPPKVRHCIVTLLGVHIQSVTKMYLYSVACAGLNIVKWMALTSYANLSFSLSFPSVSFHQVCALLHVSRICSHASMNLIFQPYKFKH